MTINSHTWLHRLIAILVAVLVSVMGQPLDAQPLSQTECSRVSVDPTKTPLWMVSGEWLSGQKMAWVDAYRKEVLEVDVITGAILKLDLPWQDELEKRWNARFEAWAAQEGKTRARQTQGPVRVRWHGSDLLLEFVAPSSTIALSADSHKTDLSAALASEVDELSRTEINLSERQVLAASARDEWQKWARSDQPPEIYSTYQFQELGEGHLAFASIRLPKETDREREYRESFVYVSSQGFIDLGPQLKKAGVNEATKEQVRQHALFYMPYLAEVSGIGYALLFDTTPKLIRYVPGGELLVLPLPSDLTRPALKWDKSLSPLENDIQDYLKIERSDMVVGLYSVSERLFALAKKSTPGNLVAWWMIELDPQTGAEHRRLRLPTRGDAEHLTVIPGPTHVALVEKSAVQSYSNRLYFETLSVTTLPTDWLISRDEVWNPLLNSSSVFCR